jgi:nucleoside-diphosphate-sugar epimerase
MQATPHLLVFGLGYTGRAIAAAAAAQGWHVAATSRDPAAVPPPCVSLQPFDRADLAGITHVVATAPPAEGADPVLARHGAALAASQTLRWAGYLSTTGVYGDRGGAWVDEDTPPRPTGPRGALRVAIEQAWVATLGARCAVDLFRVAGIYGPGRSPLDDLRAGRARRIVKPGHAFGRIHRDDIARAVIAAAAQDRPPGPRVLHLNDDEPAETARVIEAAAALLGIAPPPEIDYATAAAGMSEMGRSFWAENRKVACAKTRAALGIDWRYPTYREGLAAILAEERGQLPKE